MQRQWHFSFLAAAVFLLAACSSMPGKTPTSASPPAPSSALTAAQQLAPLVRRINDLDDFVRQRALAEHEARNIAATVVAQPTFTGIPGCFEVPKQLTRSVHYDGHGSVMDVQYAVACLFGAKKLEDQKAKAKQQGPAPLKKK